MEQALTPFAHGLLTAARYCEAQALETGDDAMWKQANALFAKVNAEMLKSR